MCLMAVAVNAHPRFPMVLLANRDEFHHRPAHHSQWWQGENGPTVFGGRDLQAGGTWMALNERGQLAALTNIRQPGAPAGERSRGFLVLEALSDAPWKQIEWARYASFNLIVLQAVNPQRPGGAWALRYRNSTGLEADLRAGVHGLSNASLNTPWPKTNHLTTALRNVLASDDVSLDQLLSTGFNALNDRRQWPDAALPNTGVPLEWERLLSACQIVSPDYGTRCSTVVAVDSAGAIHWEERSYDPQAGLIHTVQEHWRSLPPSAPQAAPTR